jgi:hypothetical protein
VPLELTEKSQHLRFSLLTKRLVDIASEGSKDNERYLAVMEDAIQIEAKLDAISLAEEQANIEKHKLQILIAGLLQMKMGVSTHYRILMLLRLGVVLHLVAHIKLSLNNFEQNKR